MEGQKTPKLWLVNSSICLSQMVFLIALKGPPNRVCSLYKVQLIKRAGDSFPLKQNQRKVAWSLSCDAFSGRQSSGASFTLSCHLIPNNNTVLWQRFSRTLPFKKIYCDNLLVIGFKIFSKKVYFAICAYAIYKLMYYNIQFLLNKYCIGWAVQIRKKKAPKILEQERKMLEAGTLVFTDQVWWRLLVLLFFIYNSSTQSTF